MNWQPIATCPKENGVPILLYYSEGEYVVGSWIDDSYFTDTHGSELNPTHWQALTPPITGQDGGWEWFNLMEPI